MTVLGKIQRRRRSSGLEGINDGTVWQAWTTAVPISVNQFCSHICVCILGDRKDLITCLQLCFLILLVSLDCISFFPQAKHRYFVGKIGQNGTKFYLSFLKNRSEQNEYVPGRWKSKSLGCTNRDRKLLCSGDVGLVLWCLNSEAHWQWVRD